MIMYTLSLFIFVQILLCTILSAKTCQADDKGNDELGLTAAEIIRLRGFNAEDHYIVTTDGYVLNLIRATNNGTSLPNKHVIFFVHGILTNSKCFLVDSIGASPEDYSHLNASDYSEEELNEQFGLNPNSRSLVFISLNFGHEVWLINRRGTRYSLGHVNPDYQPAFSNITTNHTSNNNNNNNNSNSSSSSISNNNRFNKILSQYPNPLSAALRDYYQLFSNPEYFKTIGNQKYWNYTIDTEATYDIPESIDYILEKTGREKLTVVGHSLGGALPLFALYRNPDLANKLHQIIAWAPGVDQGAVPFDELPPLELISLLFEVPFKLYGGPITPTIINPIAQSLAATVCETELTAETLCSAAASFIFGDGGDQQHIFPGLLSAAPESVGTHELAQLIEDIHSNRTHYYDYSSPRRNMIAYGQPTPPLYDFSKLTFSNMYIFYGNTDEFVQYQSVQQFLGDLTVPVKSRFFNDTGLYWNHISFLIHKKISTYLILPSLIYIESF